jgi:serine/threonine-protein kinase
MRISANGGASESLIKAKSGVLYAPQQILPDGKSVLYSACVSRTQCNTMVQSLVSGEAKQLFEGVAARYLPTGHLVYRLFNDDDLFAVPFNLERLEVTGAPVRIAENVETAACSDTGTFVYISAVASSASSNQRALLWVDRKGKEEAVKAPLDAYRDIRISPDGMRVALTIVKTGGNSDIWVWDMMRNTTTRLTFDKTHALLPLWTPDSRQISFSSHREESHGVYLKSADGTGKDERLPPVKGRNIFPAFWTGSGKVLLAEIAPLGSASFDIGALSMGDGINQEWKLLMQEQYVEVQPRVSPEGRYMAYTSNESGRSQVYVRPFPDVDEGGRWQISTGGGDSPLWSREGGELFYRNGDAAMVVSVKTQPAFSLETPKLLFRGMYVPSNIKTNDPQSNTWDISPDGKRFLMMKESGSSESAARGPRRINIVLNWFEELKQRVPTK